MQPETLFHRAPDYSHVYEHLAELREEFHRSGKLDDSNAKLDEVVKLFATYLAFRSGHIGFFPNLADDRFSLIELQKAFSAVCALPEYQRPDGISIFGEHPRLTLTQGDVDLAKRLASLAKASVDEAFRHFAEGRSYDVLNEAFGHFVRDNFRGNVEDAQFLTPSEVVDFAIELALEELIGSGRLDGRQPLVVADPCSGVASFLAAFSTRYAALTRTKPSLELLAQDKVERMVRLSTINLALHRSSRYTASIGNSVFGGSGIDAYDQKVDLVLTNPPFGARFPVADLQRHGSSSLPFFSKPIQLRGPVDSELLFIDRDLHLLREGGLLAIIVPDSVVSAKGTPALLRHHLKHSIEVKAIIELPSVTFAQAGTRTKTAVVLLRKQKPAPGKAFAFLARSKSLGFQVSSRKGVLVKSAEGASDLPSLLAAYKGLLNGEQAVLSLGQDIAYVSQEKLKDVWTPGHYVECPSSADEKSGLPLSAMVSFVGDERKARRHSSGDTYISVLHVLGDGLVDLQATRSYAPKTPGIPVYPGEILLSRINPRIPRVMVVPKIDGGILCSSEFEVMRAKPGFDPYLICFLLLAPSVQQQVTRRTSGTSASHSRIKTRELATLKLPLSRSQERLIAVAKSYERAISKIYSGMKMIADARSGSLEFEN